MHTTEQNLIPHRGRFSTSYHTTQLENEVLRAIAAVGWSFAKLRRHLRESVLLAPVREDLRFIRIPTPTKIGGERSDGRHVTLSRS